MLPNIREWYKVFFWVDWRFVVLVGVAILATTVGCDEPPTPPSAPAGRSGPPEPPVRISHDAVKSPSSPVQGESSEESRPGKTPALGGSLASPAGASQPGVAGGQRGNLPVTRPGAPLPSGSQPRFPAQLSAGMALPQSLPTGTALGMSVDYVLLETLPTAAVQAVWVIESAQAGNAEVPVRLAAQGNLMTFITNMKPEHGPFHSYLAVVFSDGHREPISPQIEMRSP